MTLTKEQFDLEFPEEERKSLLNISNSLELEGQSTREYYLKEWKKFDYWWRNIQNIYWSEVGHDWRPYEEGIRNNNLEEDPENLGETPNIFRAYGTSIIAGLSASLPSVRFSPDDAENPDDQETAKAFGKISDLIDKHNDISLKFVKALFILFNQPFVAAYNYHNTDPSYGMKKVPVEMDVTSEVLMEVCPNCYSETEESYCANCGDIVIPEMEVQEVQETITVEENSPKGREVIEIYGPVEVKIPFYVSDMANSPYIYLETEHHYSLLKDKFPWIADKIREGKDDGSLDRWARKPSDGYSDHDSKLNTLKRRWLRPWTFNMEPDEVLREKLKQKYPNGVYVCFVDDIFAEAFDENMDEHWTISESPISRHIYDIPMGKTIEDVQEMFTDIVNLVIETIRYGVPLTFADANAISWDKLGQERIKPGMVIPAQVKSGQNLGSMFHTVKTATLSQEVDNFWGRLEQLGQFLSGAFPSIYGGTLTGGSKTYKEYESSRSQALQRLSLTWKMLNIWFKKLKLKSCKEYAKNITSDEAFAQKQGEGFVNVWIRQSELKGSVGEVEAETSDQFPQTLQQKRGMLLEFMSMKSPMLDSILMDPENFGTLKTILGFNELYIPGSDQRDRQIREIFDMMKSEPIEVATEDGMQEMQAPAIPIEPYDNNAIHLQTITAFLNTLVGQDLKTSNPMAYQNIMLHRQMHEQALMMEQMQQAQMAAEQNPENGNPEGENRETVQ